MPLNMPCSGHPKGQVPTACQEEGLQAHDGLTGKGADSRRPAGQHRTVGQHRRGLRGEALLGHSSRCFHCVAALCYNHKAE